MTDRRLTDAAVIVTDHATGARVRQVTVRLIAGLFRTDHVILTEGSSDDFTPLPHATAVRLPGSDIPLGSLDGEIVAEITWTGATSVCTVDVLIELWMLDRAVPGDRPAMFQRRYTLGSATGPHHRATAAIPVRDLLAIHP
jgi:hypothetical protein